MISYEKELDIDNKLHNYLKITVILNNVFRAQKTHKKTRIKLYNTQITKELKITPILDKLVE